MSEKKVHPIIFLEFRFYLFTSSQIIYFLPSEIVFSTFHQKKTYITISFEKVCSLVRQPFFRLNLKLTRPTIYIFVATHIKGVKISRQTNNSKRMKNETLHKHFKTKCITGTKRQSNKQKNRDQQILKIQSNDTFVRRILKKPNINL